MIIGPAILGELEAVLVETCGWTSDRAAAVRAELEAIAAVVALAVLSLPNADHRRRWRHLIGLSSRDATKGRQPV